MRIAIYSRKSRFTGKGESIENQVEMCREHIFKHIEDGKSSDILVYEDEGFSGKNLERPQFKKMMQDAKRQPFDFIVCYRLDRISRSIGDFATLIEELNEREINFICIKEQFDTSTPMGRAMMYIASVFAQLERETIAERVRDNMLMLAKMGRWLGGTTPTGYASEKVDNMIVDGKVRSYYRLSIKPEEIQVVRLIYDKFQELRSLAGVSKYLIQQGIRSRTGNHYTPLAVKDILTNPVYCSATKDVRDYFIKQDSTVGFSERECSGECGLISYNKRDYKKKRTARLPKHEWVIGKGQHPSVVDGAIWMQIQEVLENNKAEADSPGRSLNEYSLLSGRIFCKKCGARMFAKVRKRTDKQIIYDYICNSKGRGNKFLCDSVNLNGIETDEMVCDYLKAYANPDSHIYALLEELKRKIDTGEQVSPLEDIDRRIADCTTEMDKIVRLVTKPDISDIMLKSLDQKLTELDSDLKRMEMEKASLEENRAAASDKNLQYDMLIQLFANFKDTFDRLTVQDKRDFIHILVDKLEWDGANLDIFMYGE